MYSFYSLFIFEVPCVGVSIGIERIFSILEAKAEVTYNLFRIYFFREFHNFHVYQTVNLSSIQYVVW